MKRIKSRVYYTLYESNCIDCGKPVYFPSLKYPTKRCKSCARKGKLNPNYKGDKTIVCKFCGRAVPLPRHIRKPHKNQFCCDNCYKASVSHSKEIDPDKRKQLIRERKTARSLLRQRYGLLTSNAPAKLYNQILKECNERREHRKQLKKG